MQPIIHWMDASECTFPPANLSPSSPLFRFFCSVSSDQCYCLPGLHHIRLSDRVMVGKDGNLYFANLLTEDSRKDYTCNIQYLAARTILAKEPTTLIVNPCEFSAVHTLL